ncbi:VOC family protein [Allopusillimonas soli]|uniref:VOC family protein n=1 Tax=Allopusillimonas soli TaxID=659016 RepID=A0A853FBM3_9BURK|nr:VOC family protein [Allopusillimonas soli]NYT38165.1 VOC family protein [Allopusillimonas soli]TEA74037.1 VOC family protein [Allopusillimonas soli]
MTDWKPSGYPSISPYLICKNPEASIAFMREAFDGSLLRRFDRPDGSLMHAEVRIGDSVVMIGGGETGHQSAHVHIHLYVNDAKSVFERAIAAGATQVQAPIRKRPDDDLRGGVQDSSGTIWWIATQ